MFGIVYLKKIQKENQSVFTEVRRKASSRYDLHLGQQPVALLLQEHPQQAVLHIVRIDLDNSQHSPLFFLPLSCCLLVMGWIDSVSHVRLPQTAELQLV